jgi:hypothetical protein
MRFVLGAALIITVACNGKSDKTTPDQPAPIDAAPSTVADAGGATSSTDAGPAPLTEAECRKFIDHVVRIVRVEHDAKVDPSVRPSDEQVTKIRTKLRAEDLQLCMKLPRPIYECALRARNKAQYLACQPKKP